MKRLHVTTAELDMQSADGRTVATGRAIHIVATGTGEEINRILAEALGFAPAARPDVVARAPRGAQWKRERGGRKA